MNTADLLQKLTQIRSSPLDDCEKCKAAIDLTSRTLLDVPPWMPISPEAKRQLLRVLDDFYARALQQQRLSQNQRCTNR